MRDTHPRGVGGLGPHAISPPGRGRDLCTQPNPSCHCFHDIVARKFCHSGNRNHAPYALRWDSNPSTVCYCLRVLLYCTDVPCAHAGHPPPRSWGLGAQTMPFHRPAEAGTYARSRTLPATFFAITRKFGHSGNRNYAPYLGWDSNCIGPKTVVTVSVFSTGFTASRQHLNLRLCLSPHSPQAPVVIVVAEAAAREAGGRAADATNG
jgi:hypothetical protein